MPSFSTSVTARRVAAAAAVALGAALVPSVAAASAPVQDPVVITPNTSFVGLVNSATADPVITVVCPGPITANSVGHPTSGQTAEVRSVLPPTTQPAGYTGSLGHQIAAGFTSATSAAQGIVFTSYFAPAKIPTTWLLPCGGTGTMTFVPQPTSPTARSFSLTVTFVNIAA